MPLTNVYSSKSLLNFRRLCGAVDSVPQTALSASLPVITEAHIYADTDKPLNVSTWLIRQQAMKLCKFIAAPY